MTETRAQVPAQTRRETGSGAGPATPAEIESQIQATREHLAATIDHIGARVKPRNVARRTGTRVRGTVVDEFGRPRPARIALLAVVVAAVATLVWRRRR